MKDNVLKKGEYEIKITDPFHKNIKKGMKIKVENDIVSDERVMGDFIFYINVGGKKLGFTKDMLKKV